MITREQVISDTESRGNRHELKLYSDLYKKEVNMVIFAKNRNVETDITDWVVKSINSFSTLKPDVFTDMKSKTWEYFNISMKNSSFGVVSDALLEKHNGDEELANREYFGFKDMDDAFNSLKLREVTIVDINRGEDLVYSLDYDISWDDHGLSFLFVNNRLTGVE